MKRKAEQDEKDYVRDVEAVVGIPLQLEEKKKKRRGFVNRNYGTARKRVKTEGERSRERLEKKLFDRKAMRRVAETLAEIQRHRAQKAFGNQYVHAVQR
ncbi:unnamed protein product [Bursaphelenchus okinawaensis]|uniref:Uncharacterized protein n=1 Tax=Bursaphelenchus okinawaensis TaxID=465554 RepID=A0A811KSK3_9BILA|nr:unnamed protein product [Bursaphelenchus okinawaensis]CAG9109753.1 unnamed protein product [Bursaphelenchus okinawaensis]